MSPTMTADRWARAQRFSEFLATAEQHAAQWRDTYRLAKLPDETVSRAGAIPGRWRLAVLVEDWCGDAVNTVPYVARLAEVAPHLEVRVFGRDANPDLMDAHLGPAGARAIPAVIVYDEEGREHGWWGSRPGPLTAWFETEGRALEKAERYRHIRGWYARDRGRTTLDEVLAIVERGAAAGAQHAA
ncbi:MAG TPA: thioredoxin family protein [Gemmatirosa sp.]|nr:thioredoxin family protein [Gemmatirosa sp.]